MELSNLIASKKVPGAKTPFRYHLDCMIQSFQAWPTWVRLPCASRHVPDLKIDLRIFETREFAWHRYMMPFLTVFQLLNHLFYRGLYFFCEGREWRSMTVGTLQLDIIFIDEVGSTSWKDRSGQDRLAGQIATHLRNLELHGVLSGYVGKIVCCSDSYENKKIIEVRQRRTPITNLEWRTWRSFGFSWGPNPGLGEVQQNR